MLFDPDADPNDTEDQLQAIIVAAQRRREAERDDPIRVAWNDLAAAAGELQRQMRRAQGEVIDQVTTTWQEELPPGAEAKD